METINSKKRILAKIVAIIFIVSAILSFVFIVKEANHKCNHIDCQICHTIQQCLKNINNQNTHAGNDNVGNINFSFGLFIVPSVFIIFVFKTLVNLKVKLSN